MSNDSMPRSLDIDILARATQSLITPLLESIRLATIYSFRPPRELPRYLISLEAKFRCTESFIAPKRLVYLDLRLSDIYCINSTWYRFNNTKPMTKIYKSILTINITSTNVHRPPNGSFICIRIGSYSIGQGKQIESNIETTNHRAPRLRFTYVPKSTTELNIYGFPRMRELIVTNRLTFNSYNLHYHVDKRINGENFIYWSYKLDIDSRVEAFFAHN